MKSKMKNVLSASVSVILFALIFNLHSFAQNVHPHYWDGQIYFRTAKLPLMGGDGPAIDLKEAGFLSQDLISQYGITRLEKPFWRAKAFDIQSIYHLSFNNSAGVYELIKILERMSVIDYAEQVPIHKTTLTPNDLGPNLTNSNGQWHLWKIQAQQAWDISVGSAQITVAIVDDAVKADHPDLAPSIWTNPGEIPNNGIDDDNNGYIDDVNGYDVADNDNNVLPNTNNMAHGTHVAGISGAATNNGTGIASIGYNLKIIPVKASNQPTTISAGYSGVIYAADAGARVINMSWGGAGGGQTGQNIINYANARGCIMVAAAGNDNSTTTFFPANYNHVISVASTTNTDAKSSFSNYGTWIDISAPGSSIRSTYINSSTGAANYAFNQGTSMASPLVAGLCGLMLSLNPNLTKAQLENCLYSTADPVTTNLNQMGAGRINAYEAMQCVLTTVAAPPVSVISASNTQGCAGATIQFQGGSSGGPATSYQWTFPGGNPSSSTLQNPVVTYPANGQYSVTLQTTNQYGTNTSTETNFIVISNAATEVFYTQDFENANHGFTTINPDNGITWAIATTGGNLSGTKSAFMNFFNYNTTGQRDGFVSPSIDFSQHVNIELEFTHAYRRYNQQSSDSMIIRVSTDNGATWTRVWQRGENGTGTFATQSTSTANFVPAQAADWCYDGTIGTSCFVVPLNQFDGQPNVRINFEGYNNYGNNLYLDDVEIRGICNTTLPPPPPPVAQFSADKNVLCEGESMTIINNTQNADTYQWTFTGGTPSSSNLAAPTIVYNTSGTYNVTLTATGPGGSTTETFTAYVVVNPTPDASITQNGNVLTALPAGLFYQWFINGTPIGGATSQEFVVTQNGTYTVQVINEEDCSDVSNAVTVNNLSLEDVVANFDIQLYPNPAQNVVNITWADNGMPLTQYRILNAIGQEIDNKYGAFENQITVDVSHLAQGVYYLGLTFGEQRELLKKVVVVK